MKVLFFTGLMALSLAAFGTEKEIKIGVSGMVCSFCAQGITKKFNAEPAVASVDVKLGEKAVNLKIKDGQTLSDQRITEILTDSGYKVEKITRP
jgi:mercuric ion binding protein